MIKDIRNYKAYDAFDSEVGTKCMYGNGDIYWVAKQFVKLYREIRFNETRDAQRERIYYFK